MLVRLDAADRLVRVLEARGPLPAAEAAELLLALVSAPAAVARAVLDEAVRLDARLQRHGDVVRLAPPPGAAAPLEKARFVVVDVETTGFSPGRARICELAAVVVEEGEIRSEHEGSGDDVRGLLALAGDGVLAGHNLRFDLAFLDRELDRTAGDRLAVPAVDTLVLARRLLAGRIERASLAALAEFFGTSERPCHRALPDARATAEVLLRLVGLAVERGARTVADLCALSRPRPIRASR